MVTLVICEIFAYRCDRTYNCHDGSDEDDCRLMIIDDSYQPHIPPPPLDPSSATDKANIALGVNIKNILEVSEVHSILEVQFQLKMVWRDPRLVFWNLKEGDLINIASKDEAHTIWHPEVVVVNTKYQPLVEV